MQHWAELELKLKILGLKCNVGLELKLKFFAEMQHWAELELKN